MVFQVAIRLCYLGAKSVSIKTTNIQPQNFNKILFNEYIVTLNKKVSLQ